MGVGGKRSDPVGRGAQSPRPAHAGTSRPRPRSRATGTGGSPAPTPPAPAVAPREPVSDGGGDLAARLRAPGFLLAAGAHDALSARLSEDAGFDVVWASGFGISASHGVPDANILTLTENRDAVRRIVDAVRIPVVADCDNGYGNAINVIRTVAEFERVGAAGICIEDNVFPKRCSFYPGVRRDLVPVEEHVRKIRAAKSAQRGPGFVVIARTEALIAGWGMEEALARADAYAAAGANAVLVHSKAPSFDAELRAFVRRWRGGCPLVVVPTTYPAVTATELEAAGVKMAIFANQALRAAIVAMRETLAAMRLAGSLAAVEDRIAPLEDVYELVGVGELKANERQFLVPGAEKTTAIIIAAGFEEQLMPLIEDRPKSMLEVRGRTILERQLRALAQCGVRDVSVVRGYRKECIDLPNLRYYDNDRYRDTGELASLFEAEAEMGGRFLFLYGDIIFDPSILEKLLRSDGDVSLVVDRAWCDAYRAGAVRSSGPADLVVTDPPPPSGYRFVPGEVRSGVRGIGPGVDPAAAHGEFIGLALFSAAGAAALRAAYHRVRETHAGRPFRGAESVERAAFTHLVQELIESGARVDAVDVYKGWMEVDTFDDYRRAWAQLERR
jgi:phosphoenolpyruvate phosphomutase